MEDGASGSGTDDVIDEKDENANSDDSISSATIPKGIAVDD